MLILMKYMMIISIISLSLLTMPMFLMTIKKKWMNKLSTIECGMNQNSMMRKPFSIRFFLLMILFIIFDIEIILIITVPMLTPWNPQMMIFLFMFIMVLLNGLMYEWMEGSLNWKM